MATVAINAMFVQGAIRSEALEPVAELRGVTRCFGDLCVLRDFHLALYPGEIVALLGPNGAGKSTVVRLLLGLIAPDAGGVSIFGADPRKSATRLRIGAMLQVGNVPEALTTGEHLDLFRSYYPAPMPMSELVRVAGLEQILHRRFGQLSGGQKQRVLFALAIAGDPDILFLDEPTLGMDVETRRSLWREIEAFSARGKTVLLTTHYVEEADALATRIIIINRGQVLRDGTPHEIKNSGGPVFVRCTTSVGEAQLRRLPGVLAVSTEPKSGARMLATDDPEALFLTLQTQNIQVRGWQILSPTLEDAFLNLIRSSTK